jgi:hypothetical protein
MQFFIFASVLQLFLVFSINSAEVSKPEPKFFLVPKVIKGTGTIKVFKSYQGELLTVLPIVSDGELGSMSKIIVFDGGYNKSPASIIAAYLKKGEFFKVSFEGKPAWVHSEDMGKVYDIAAYFEHLGDGLSVNLKKGEIFKEPGVRSSLIDKKKIRKNIPMVFARYANYYTKVKFLGLRYVEQALWVNAQACEVYQSMEYVQCKSPIKFWFMPYGTTKNYKSWAYPAKNIGF